MPRRSPPPDPAVAWRDAVALLTSHLGAGPPWTLGSGIRIEGDEEDGRLVVYRGNVRVDEAPAEAAEAVLARSRALAAEPVGSVDDAAIIEEIDERIGAYQKGDGKRSPAQIVAAARAAGASGELAYLGAGMTGVVLGSPNGLAYKVARHPNYGPSLEEEADWLAAAARVPLVADQIAHLRAWRPDLLVIVKDRIEGRPGRWADESRLWAKTGEIDASMRALAHWTGPERKPDSWIVTPDGRDVLVDAGMGHRLGPVLVAYAEEVLAGKRPVASPEETAWELLADATAGFTPRDEAERLAAALRAMRKPNCVGVAAGALALATALPLVPPPGPTDVLDPFLVGAAVHHAHGRHHNPRERPEVPWFEVFRGKGAPGPGERGYVDPLARAGFDVPLLVARTIDAFHDADLGPMLHELLASEDWVEDYGGELLDEEDRMFATADLPELLGVPGAPLEDALFVVGRTFAILSHEPDAQVVPGFVEAEIVLDALRALDKPRIVNVDKEEAFAFVKRHHSALPAANPRGLLYAIGVQVRGRLVAVALANTPAARYGARACSVDGIVDLSRIASDGSTLGASSMLAARLIDVLERSGRRGEAGCLLATQSLLTEAGTTYLALADKGLRPVALIRGKKPGGSRRAAGLEALPHLPKIVWEAGPAALPPDWKVLEKTPATEKQIAGARKQWEAWHAREELAAAKRLRQAQAP